jgi:adenylate cyclase
MKLRFRVALLAAIAVLMIVSLGAVSAFVLLRNNESSRAISSLQIEQALTDVGDRIKRFLEKGPLALDQMQRLVVGRLLNLNDVDQLEGYLVNEMRADLDLTWLSYSSAETGAFIGVTRRDGTLILNRSALDVDGGRPREWEIRDYGVRVPLSPKLQVPYDPRSTPWFLLGLQSLRPHWTDLYRFAEGEWGVSTVLKLRLPEGSRSTGVATADFHLRVIEDFLTNLRVGKNGRAAIIVPQLTGNRIVLGGNSLPPAMASALAGAANTVSGGQGISSLQGLDIGEATGAEPVFIKIRALELGSQRPWFLTVMVPTDEVNGPIERATRDTLLVIAAFLAVGVGIAVWIANAITRPIRSMSRDLRRVGELRFSSLPPARSFIHEMDTMAKTLAAMKAALRSFALYVPVELVRATLSSGREVEPGGEMRVLTVLFTDVDGFTKIAETLPPERLSRDLGSYFCVLERAITKAGGLVDKFMGDGAMALFNAPTPLPNHAAQACEAALALHEELKVFNLERQAKGLPPFRTRIGLALGPALVGNIGTSSRLAYTAIGDVVNLSSHLEAMNKIYGTSVLADKRVQAEASDRFEWKYLDRAEVAGREAPVELYELLGRKGGVDAATLRARDLHEAALRALIVGNSDAAERGFAAVINIDPQNWAARHLLQRTLEAREFFSDESSGDRRRGPPAALVHG